MADALSSSRCECLRGFCLSQPFPLDELLAKNAACWQKTGCSHRTVGFYLYAPKSFSPKENRASFTAKMS